jgi:Ni,Fe-hydrogenase III small subunit
MSVIHSPLSACLTLSALWAVLGSCGLLRLRSLDLVRVLLGIRFVASPRHADLLLVTGPVCRHMERALKSTYDATPDPKLVVALGDCGCTGGIFGENYASRGRVANVIPVDVAIPGCPPSPTRILEGILAAIERSARATTAARIQRP